MRTGHDVVSLSAALEDTRERRSNPLKLSVKITLDRPNVNRHLRSRLF
jgi:hypothetical protein